MQAFAERFRIRRPVDLLSAKERAAIHEASLHEDWVAKGRRDPMAVAREKTAWILAHHTPEPLPPETAARLDRVARDFATR